MGAGFNRPFRRLSDRFGGVIGAEYLNEPPDISASPSNKITLGITPSGNDPIANFGGPGCYIMRVPDGVQNMRMKLWGGRGAGGIEPGFVQADLKVIPGELLFVIIGLDGGNHNPKGVIRSALSAFGGPGVYDLTNPAQTSDLFATGGGFTSVSRLTQTIITTYNIAAPTSGQTFARYAFRENARAILDAGTLLLLAGASGGYGNGGSPRGGYPKGDGALPAYGGTQTAGGTGSSNYWTGGTGLKFQGGESAPVAGTSGQATSQPGGGGGYYGGGGGVYYSGQTPSGGGGSSYINPTFAYSPVAPSFGQPAGDADAPAGNGARYQGKLVALWD